MKRSEFDVLADKCPVHLNRGKNIMMEFHRSKGYTNKFEEHIQKISIQNLLFDPSQKKSEICSQALTIFAETTNNFLIVCNLKEMVNKLKKYYRNEKLEALLDEYLSISKLINRGVLKLDEITSLERFISEEKKGILRKKIDLSPKSLERFFNIDDVPPSSKFVYGIIPQEVEETEALKLFDEEKAIENNDDEMNIQKLLSLEESSTVIESNWKQIETTPEPLNFTLPQRRMISRMTYYRLNSLRTSFGISDDDLRNLCKNIVRETRREVAGKHHPIVGVYSDEHLIIKQFKNLINIATRKLEKHPIQYFIEKIYLEHVKDRTENYAAISAMLDLTRKDVSAKINIVVSIFYILKVDRYQNKFHNLNYDY